MPFEILSEFQKCILLAEVFTCKIQQTAAGAVQPTAKSAKKLSTRKQKIQIFGAKAVGRSNFSSKYKMSRGGFEAERQTCNLKVAGSTPSFSIDFMISDFYQKIKVLKMFFLS